MKYAVAFTTHGSETTGIKLSVIEANNKEEAIGKFIINEYKSTPNVLLGAFQVKGIEDAAK